MSNPDFEALRARRNAAMRDMLTRFAEREGVPVNCVVSTFNFDSCYCACTTGGPCEHRWDGPVWESDDGALSTATCSRCGMTAFSHSMRTAE